MELIKVFKFRNIFCLIKISKLKIFFRFFYFYFLFFIFFTGNPLAIKSINSLDFSGKSPLFLTKKEIKEDLDQVKILFQENYVHYPILLKSGIKWNVKFQKVVDHFSMVENPILTHHFQKKLIKVLEFTEDTNLRTDLFLKKRHYVQKIEPQVAFYSGIRLAHQKKGFRVIPSSIFEKNITNFWFINCSKDQEFFPILPERHSENLFMLGGLANHQLKPFSCKFKNISGEKQNITVPLYITKAELNLTQKPIYEFDDSRTPYLRWFRDGKNDEISVKNFQKLARQLRGTTNLIIDVRGNKSGSFSFIEKWLKEFTRNHWKNVIVKEKQNKKILKGLLNRTQWNIFNSTERVLIGKNQLEQKRMQLKALIKHFKENGITEKWIETKFIFNGHKNSPKWNTRLIVIANQHCGDGCQFLAALTKQIPNGVLIGTNTGPFPKNTYGPIFQLKHSRIMISFSHRLHLDHQGIPVSNSGYLPDYWLFPPMGKIDIQRFISKIN